METTLEFTSIASISLLDHLSGSECNFQGRGEIEGKNGETNKKEEDFLEGVERGEPFPLLVSSSDNFHVIFIFRVIVSAVEWKCPVRPRSLNFNQRSRVLRFRRQVK